MNETVTFGRRRAAPPSLPTASFQATPLDVALTPEQRAYIFGAESLPEESPRREGAVLPPHSRRAAWVACGAVTAIVTAATLLGKSHDTVAALPPAMAEQAKAAFALAGDGFGPVLLFWSIFVVCCNLAANLWLTRKFCFWFGWFGVPAFVATSALLSVVVATTTGFIGLGDTEIGYFAEAASGAGAGLLYRLLAGRARA